VDVFRNVELSFEFAPLSYEHQFPFPMEQRLLLEDVHLQLRGRVAVDAARPFGPDDVHLYLDGVDATSAYIAELKAVLDLQNQNELRAGYRNALEKWIRLGRQLGAAYPGNIEEDAVRMEQLLAVPKFSDLVDQLGNRRNAGFSGYLHVFNYLHTAVPVPPISLRKVIERVNSAAGAQVLGPDQPRVVTFSDGTCRLFDPTWTPRVVTGGILLMAQFQYHNALLDRVVALERRLEELEEMTEEKLEKILEIVSTGGPIQKAIAQARGQTADARSAGVRVTGEVASQNQQLAGLRAAAQDLREAIDQL
jgi:hypothetical protein